MRTLIWEDALPILTSIQFMENSVLKPNDKEEVGEFIIPKCTSLKLIQWKGEPIKGPLNKKTIVEYQGEPFYAELVVLRMYRSNGWDGRWIQSFGKPQYLMDMFPHGQNVPLPDAKEGIIKKISAGIGKDWSGCWDLFLWNDINETRFIELKRRKVDALKPNQIKWLRSALENGISLSDFLIVEWDFLIENYNKP